MAPKTSKLARLRELAFYVRQPDKLAELQARSGNNLREKLRQREREETPWYDFLKRKQIFDPECQSLLEELDAEVARPPAQPVASYGGSSGSCLGTKRQAAGSDQQEGRTPARKHSPPQRGASADWRSKRPRTTLSEDSAAPTSGSDITTTLCLRGLNIQWPFSQLILLGAKTEESDIYCKS